MFFRKITILSILLIFNFSQVAATGSAGQSDSGGKHLFAVDEIMREIEKRYASTGFSAVFSQQSKLKALDMTDTATGTILVKRPGMMRWEYEKPNRHMIITDGEDLWLYRPDDNQVMTGKAPDFFKDGKGAGFLSDLKLLRKTFTVTLEKSGPDNEYLLKLVPMEKIFDISLLYLLISKENYNIIQIITYNSYDDETRIELSDIEFKDKIDNANFRFQIPEGVDILQLDESK